MVIIVISHSVSCSLGWSHPSVSAQLRTQGPDERDGPLEGHGVKLVAFEPPRQVVDLPRNAVPQKPGAIHGLLRLFLIPLEVRLTRLLKEAGRPLCWIPETIAEEGHVVLQGRDQLPNFEVRIATYAAIKINHRPAVAVGQELVAAKVAVAEGIVCGGEVGNLLEEKVAHGVEKRPLVRPEKGDPLDVGDEPLQVLANIPRRQVRDVQTVQIP